MPVTGWIEIDYVVTDPVISNARVGTDATVVIHASDVRLLSEATVHESAAGYVSSYIHIATLDTIQITTPPIIRPGVGVDEEGASRSDNVREMLRSALRKRVMDLRTIGDHYRYRVPSDLSVRLAGNSAGLVPDALNPRFSLSLSLRQHGTQSADG